VGASVALLTSPNAKMCLCLALVRNTHKSQDYGFSRHTSNAKRVASLATNLGNRSGSRDEARSSKLLKLIVLELLLYARIIRVIVEVRASLSFLSSIAIGRRFEWEREVTW
jgi:hypothetical protein